MTEANINVVLPAEWEGDGIPIAYAVNGVRVDTADGPFGALVGVEVSPPGALDSLFGPLGSQTYAPTDTDWGIVSWPQGQALCLEVGLDVPSIPRVRLLFSDLPHWLPALRSWKAPRFILADHRDPRVIDAALNGPPEPAIKECHVIQLPFPPLENLD